MTQEQKTNAPWIQKTTQQNNHTGSTARPQTDADARKAAEQEAAKKALAETKTQPTDKKNNGDSLSKKVDDSEE